MGCLCERIETNDSALAQKIDHFSFPSKYADIFMVANFVNSMCRVIMFGPNPKVGLH